MQCRIQGTLICLQHIVRDLPDSLGNCPTVQSIPRFQGAKYQQTKSSLQEFGMRFFRHWCRLSTLVVPFDVECQLTVSDTPRTPPRTLAPAHEPHARAGPRPEPKSKPLRSVA